MPVSSQTPQTQKEFIDYRFNETNDNIAAVKRTLDEVQSKLNTTFATRDYVDIKFKSLDERTVSLESDRSWIIRLIVGYVVLAVIAAVLYFKKG